LKIQRKVNPAWVDAPYEVAYFFMGKKKVKPGIRFSKCPMRKDGTIDWVKLENFKVERFL
jgi:hypothetical protein